jgi:hypothetical protein
VTPAAYQTVVNHTIRWLDYVHNVSVSVQDVPYGQGYQRFKVIVMPMWLEKYDVVYRLYYVLHELVHCMVGVKHDKNFKLVEDAILAMWDIEIVRRRVYPKKLSWKGKDIVNIPNAKRITRVRRSGEHGKDIKHR